MFTLLVEGIGNIMGTLFFFIFIASASHFKAEQILFYPHFLTFSSVLSIRAGISTYLLICIISRMYYIALII
jgi:hypothetical protein